MTKQVESILKHYDDKNTALISNLAKMLNHGTLAGTGKMVILPVDQGFEHGPAPSFAPNPPAYDPAYHFELAIKAGCNAYAAPFGFLEVAVKEFKEKIPLILKVNNSDSLYKDSKKSYTSYHIWSGRSTSPWLFSHWFNYLSRKWSQKKHVRRGRQNGSRSS